MIWRPAAAALAVCLACAGTGWAQAQPLDPRLRFRSLSTEHFVVYYHQGEAALAPRLGMIAETVRLEAQRAGFGNLPARTHVLLVDQMDLANGFATLLPRDLVVVSAAWPEGAAALGTTDDWLRLVFTHEFTHIAHLDRSTGWARVVRRIFGRTPLAFPNLLLPAWQVEGLATYREGAATGLGRLRAGDFGAIAREASRAGRPEPLDRVNGGLIDWPGSHAAYAYGAGFHEYLARTIGGTALSALADATAGRLPYTSSRVFARVAGKPLGDLWRDYEADLAASVSPAPPSGTPARRLTRHGFAVGGPRFASDRVVVYSIRGADAFPTLNEIALDGGASRALTDRYLGSTAAISPDTIYFDQLEFRRNAGIYADLYALDRRTGSVRALTREARLLDPDLSPDGSTLVCVRGAPGRRELVLIDAATLHANGTAALSVLVSEPDTQFQAPRWSPDGRMIAVERHRLGRLPEIVLVDPISHVVRLLASAVDTRFVTPAWRSDGGALVVAAAPRDRPFDLYELTVDGTLRRRITQVTGGAIWPDVSPDGETIVFVGYTVDGQDLFTLPYAASVASFEPRPAIAREPAVAPSPTTAPLPRSSPVEGRYRPWSTLPPTAWSPILTGDVDQIRAGAAVSGSDVLGYHSYAAGGTWRLSAPEGTPALPRGRPDWFGSYTYSRWWPSFWIAASEATSFLAAPAAGGGTPQRVTQRERQFEAGVAFAVRRARSAQSASAGIARATVEPIVPGGRIAARDRSAIRVAWTTRTAKTFGYSIGPERGIVAGATAEFVRRGLGALGDATIATADVRAYLPGLGGHHVAAFRIAGGASAGRADMGRIFRLGGPGPDASAAAFDRRAIGLLRGFGAQRFAGSHVVLANAEYRLPLARPQRGAGTWPVFLQQVHAAAFADVGHAWTEAFRAADIKVAAGAELAFDAVFGYFLPTTVAIGAAYGHDGAGPASGTVAYIRIGRAF
ncbi:MAG: PD40 domain-containing protein [Acidobacteria bacterium]|nr:PD40 domain-containing protein [Acidobacteriota bacterium]